MSMYKAWMNVHFRKADVQVEMNMQDDLHNYRLVYRREKRSPKGVLIRRQLRIGSSIGKSKWDDSACGQAMVAFYEENRQLIHHLGDAWINTTAKTDDVWSLMRDQLEARLLRAAA